MNREGKKYKALRYIKIYLYLMNYLQEHDDDLRRRLVSLAHFDTTTENDELITLLFLTMETFREHIHVKLLEKNKGRNPHFHFWWKYMQVVGCACCSSEVRWHLRFVFV